MLSVNPRSTRVAVAAALLALAAVGCSSARPVDRFVWVEEWRDPARGDRVYLIAPGDVLFVRVFGQEGLSGRARVRADGMISLPFLNEVKAADVTPMYLAGHIRDLLKEFVVNPVVTVSLEETRAIEVSVVGEVVRPGVYRLEPNSGVLAGLASAGGLTDFADRDRIFVIRAKQRIRFRFAALTGAEPRPTAFRMKPGDVLVAE